MGAFELGTASFILDPVSGRALSAKHQRLAEVIRDYDDTLEIMWVPPENRGLEDMNKEFCVVCRPEGKQPYIVMRVAENQMDESVLAAIIIRDNKHGSVLDQIEAMDFADQAVAAKDDYEAFLERQDFARSVLKSPLHTYRHAGKVYK